MESVKLLNRLINVIGDYYPQYDGGMAVHLPMELIALYQMGAPDELLILTFESHIQKYQKYGKLEDTPTIDDVETYLGEREYFLNYLKFFQDEILRFGIVPVLIKWLPTLIPGLAASAFHGMIRLAYGMSIHDPKEIAVSLAFWSSEYQRFDLNNDTISGNYQEIVKTLSMITKNYEFKSSLITHKMSEAGCLLSKSNLAFLPKVLDFDSVKAFAVESFYLKNNFTLLHTVTACHAFSIILPLLPDKNLSLRELWKAIVVAHLSTGLDFEFKKISIKNKIYNFDAVKENSFKTRDTHFIKLLYTCIEEYKNSKNSIYYLVAARASLNAKLYT